MGYKYKLNEMSKKASAEDAEKELDKPKTGFQVGQVTFSDDGQSKSTITNIDDTTGAISWKITQLPGFDKLYDEMDDLVNVAKRVYVKTKDDKKFREFYESARKLRNSVRTHLRNEYPDQYKRIVGVSEAMNEVDVVDLAPGTQVKAKNYIQDPKTYADTILDISDEILDQEADTIAKNPQVTQVLKILKKLSSAVKETSMSGAAGAYNTPYAFVRKKTKGKKKKSKYKMNKPSGLVNYMDYTMEEGKLGDGADLGPGPKAGPDGVNDNAYVKQFKYKLVPKSNGTYVQKGSGLEVKKLF